MLDKKRHKLEMVSILTRLYKVSEVAGVLGFKGGTAAYLFYDLPRFSVDLDFDLLVNFDEKEEERLVSRVTKLLAKDFLVKDWFNKRFTMFWLLSYKKGGRQIKIEISKRGWGGGFETKSFYGLNIPVMVLPDMMAFKLMALIDRASLAARDVFDVCYFLGLPEASDINYGLVKKRLGLSPAELYWKIVDRVGKAKKKGLLQGLGELLSDEQKAWVRNEMTNELNRLVKIQLDLVERERV